MIVLSIALAGSGSYPRRGAKMILNALLRCIYDNMIQKKQSVEIMVVLSMQLTGLLEVISGY